MATRLVCGAVNEKKPPTYVVLEGRCAGEDLCPLSHVEEGAVVCVRQLAAAPEVSDRLRELGFCEDQEIKLLSRNANLICQVCNARLGISEALAKDILVTPVTAGTREA